MRKRVLALGASLAVGLAVLTATPASAAYAATITFPGGASEFYSPFNGPATITFTFDGSEPDETFNVKVRPVGGSAVHSDTVFVNADDPSGTKEVSFGWPAISVTTEKTYEVVVSQDGVPLQSESFQLKPRLVRIVSAHPNPFLPWVNDDYKDETTIKFELSATSSPTEVRVYKANLQGKCCGNLVRFEDLGTKVPGSVPEEWIWDGRNDSSDLLPKGDYFVRIRAEDPANVVGLSNYFKVSIARTYMATDTLEKAGIKYHHTGSVTSYRRGGNCFVTKDETDKDLWITCLSASFTVYWRWAIPNGSKIQKASFNLIKVSSNICGAKKGIKGNDTFLKVGGVGQFRCRVDKAKITYGHPVES